MDFDFTTETITPDQSNLLTIGGSGGLELPTGTTAQRPVSGLSNGAMRYNTDLNNIESYVNNAWVSTGSGGTVTSVAATGGTGISVSGSPITTSGTLTITNTGVTSNVAGTGISVSGGTGAVTISNTGVLSIAGTTNQITASAATGAVTLSLPATVTIGTSLTVSGLTANSFLYSGTAGLLTTTAAPTNGQLLIGSTGAAPVAATLTAGTAIGVTNGAGSITINNTGVTSTAAGTGISVSGATGAVTITNTGVTSAVGTAGNITVSAATGAVTFNLATAGTPVSNSFVKITTDTFGRVTATTAVASSDITTALGYTPVNRAGDTMTGNLVMSGAGVQITLPNLPVLGTDAANKNYVDSAVTGLSWKQAVRVATTTNGTLATAYQNGSSVDGITLATGDRILIKNQTTQTENGIYVVNATGAPTRAADSDTGAELVGEAVFVDQGTVNSDTGWVQTTNAPITIGTSNIVYVQFTGSGTYAAGTGLTLTGNTFSLSSPVSPTLGGTGTTTAPTSGQVLVGTAGSVYAPATVGSGTGISVTAGSGSLSIANTGVTSAVGTAGNITVSAATGAVTFNLATAGTAGTYGAVTTDTFGRVTSGQVVTPIANGGTNLSSLGTANQILGVNTGATGLEYKTVTAGTAISITPAAGSITIANTGVTSAVAGTGISVSGATGAVTITNTLSTTSQTANTVFAAPNGSAGAPSFRTLVFADLTGAIQLYRENPSTPTTPLVAGTNAVAIGSGSSASGTQGMAFGLGTNASIFGTKAFANGSTATAGDAQEVLAVMRNTTANNTATELFLDGTGASQRLVLPNNSAWTFHIKVVARRTDATGGIGSWIYTGVIYKDATAGSTTIVGTSKTTIARVGITGANDPVFSADTTNGSLKILVTGITAQTFRWVATAHLAQVTN